MEILQISEKNHTPRVLLDPNAGIFEFEGISLPEDLFAFYMPVLEWFDKYIATIRKIENHSAFPPPKGYLQNDLLQFRFCSDADFYLAEVEDDC